MTEPEPQNLSDIIEIVNEFQYDEIVDNYRECNHGIKVLRLSALIDLIKRKIKELENQEFPKLNYRLGIEALKDLAGDLLK